MSNEEMPNWRDLLGKPDFDNDKISGWSMNKEEFDPSRKQEAIMVLDENEQMFESRVYQISEAAIITKDNVVSYLRKRIGNAPIGAQDFATLLEMLLKQLNEGSKVIEPRLDIKILSKQSKKTGEIDTVLCRVIFDDKQVVDKRHFIDENSYTRFIKNFEVKVPFLGVQVTTKKEFEEYFNKMTKGRETK